MPPKTRSKTVIRGFDEVVRELNRIPGAFEPLLNEVPREAKVVRSSAEILAPERDIVEEGREFRKLKDSIIVQVVKRSRKFIDVRIGPSQDAPHGLWVELGHEIRRVRRGPSIGTVPPRPFLGSSWAIHRNAVRRSLRNIARSIVSGFRPRKAA